MDKKVRLTKKLHASNADRLDIVITGFVNTTDWLLDGITKDDKNGNFTAYMYKYVTVKKVTTYNLDNC